MSDVCHIIRPRHGRLPVVVSCPHSGTDLPAEVARLLQPHLAATLPDTDWFVDELYGFAPELGVTLVRARYSRYVVDLNRDPAGQSLYTDGRRETGLVPVRSFAQEPLYLSDAPDAAAMARRVESYYRPYHNQLEALLTELRAEFPHVLLFDAHSIKRVVPSVQPLPFADMILGDQRGQTAAAPLTAAALAALNGTGRYQIAHNEPFMGGYITRHFGRPAHGVHALQLEMSQDIYMDEAAAARDGSKQAAVQQVLRTLLTDLAATLDALS